MKRLIAGAVIAVCASAVHANDYGDAQRANTRYTTCNLAGNVAQLNFLLLSHNREGYSVPPSVTDGHLRDVLQDSANAGSPDHNIDQYAAHRAGFAYCLDNL